MDIPQDVMDDRRIAELSGDSRDRNLRPLLEKKARRLIWCLFNNSYDLAEAWFDADIRLITNLNYVPGTTFLGKREAIEYFKTFNEGAAKYDLHHYLNVVLVTADRGSITSHVERFSRFDFGFPTHKETLLVVIDLGDSNDIRRMELRLLRKEEVAKGDWDDDCWNEVIAKMATKPVVVDHTI